MTARKFPVAEFAVVPGEKEPGLREVLDLLREVIGRVTALVDVLLVFDLTGGAYTGAAAPGTTVDAAGVTLDFDDAKLDTFRIIGAGSSSAGSCFVTAHDTADDRELCRAALPTSDGLFAGEWTLLPRALRGERSIELRVIGNGVADQLLYNVHLQARTTQFR